MKITSQHPNYPNVYATSYAGKRFDFNTKSRIVWESMRLDVNTGFHHNVEITNECLSTHLWKLFEEASLHERRQKELLK